MFFTVVLRRTICPVDSKCVIKPIFCITIEIIPYISNFVITDGLNISILCNVDRKAAAIEQIICLCFCITLLSYKIIYNLIYDSIDEISVRFGCSCICCCFGNAVIYIISHSFIVFSLCDNALFLHVFQNFFPSFCIILRVADRIQIRRTLSDRCDNCTFRKSQVFCIFIKVTLCGCLNSEASLT